MSLIFLAEAEEDLLEPAAFIIEQSEDFPVVLLKGEMGAGKTTLVSAIMKSLNGPETSSPTFSLVNTYDTEQGAWFHFDLHRVKSSEELLDFGFEEYIDSGRPCLIEWPQIAMELIEAPYLEIGITEDHEERRIEIIEVQD